MVSFYIREVAVRGNTGHFYWKIPLPFILPNEIPVIPLDNSAQGIFTIGDIKDEIHKKNKL